MVDDSKIIGRESNISITMDSLTEKQFNSLSNTAIDLSSFDYHITQNNCAHFALYVFNSIRENNSEIIVPNSKLGIFNLGITPAGVYRSLENMKKNGTKNIDKTNSKPVSSPEC